MRCSIATARLCPYKAIAFFTVIKPRLCSPIAFCIDKDWRMRTSRSVTNIITQRNSAEFTFFYFPVLSLMSDTVIVNITAYCSISRCRCGTMRTGCLRCDLIFGRGSKSRKCDGKEQHGEEQKTDQFACCFFHCIYLLFQLIFPYKNTVLLPSGRSRLSPSESPPIVTHFLSQRVKGLPLQRQDVSCIDALTYLMKFRLLFVCFI